MFIGYYSGRRPPVRTPLSTNLTAQRPPSPCSKHLDGQAVNTATRQSGPLTLRQHRCANGCNTPLGWDFTNHADGVFLHGPDECQDPRVDVAFEVWRGKAIAAPIIAVAITTGCLILAVMAAAAITARARTAPPTRYSSSKDSSSRLPSRPLACSPYAPCRDAGRRSPSTRTPNEFNRHRWQRCAPEEPSSGPFYAQQAEATSAPDSSESRCGSSAETGPLWRNLATRQRLPTQVRSPALYRQPSPTNGDAGRPDHGAAVSLCQRPGHAQ